MLHFDLECAAIGDTAAASVVSGAGCWSCAACGPRYCYGVLSRRARVQRLLRGVVEQPTDSLSAACGDAESSQVGNRVLLEEPEHPAAGQPAGAVSELTGGQLRVNSGVRRATRRGQAGEPGADLRFSDRFFSVLRTRWTRPVCAPDAQPRHQTPGGESRPPRPSSRSAATPAVRIRYIGNTLLSGHR